MPVLQAKRIIAEGPHFLPSCVVWSAEKMRIGVGGPVPTAILDAYSANRPASCQALSNAKKLPDNDNYVIRARVFPRQASAISSG